LKKASLCYNQPAKEAATAAAVAILQQAFATINLYYQAGIIPVGVSDCHNGQL